MHDRWYEDEEETTSPRLPFLQAYLFSSEKLVASRNIYPTVEGHGDEA
jgi:hypothetical protein